MVHKRTENTDEFSRAKSTQSDLHMKSKTLTVEGAREAANLHEANRGKSEAHARIADRAQAILKKLEAAALAKEAAPVAEEAAPVDLSGQENTLLGDEL